ncbi:hypothetical protein [Catellatospora methionotrophica]|uniref:hypothetical protein n=1 Tax=Catellatospora methionotrophica TaxID=121620 RepID=UPI0033F22B33
MSDDLRRLLADASRAASPYVRPPGHEAARRTLRRRRVTRVSGLAVVLALALVLGTNLIPQSTSPVPPLLPTPSTGPTADPSASPSWPAPTPTGTPSPVPTPSPGAGASPSPGALPSGTPRPTGQPVANPSPSASPSPSPSPSPPPPACVDLVVPQITNATTPAPATMTFSIAPADLDRLCEGWQIHVSWAAYRTYDAETQMYTSGGDFVLTAASPTRTGRLWSEYGCTGDRYFSFGSLPTLPDTFPRGEHLDLPSWAPGRTTGVFLRHYLVPQPGC